MASGSNAHFPFIPHQFIFASCRSIVWSLLSTPCPLWSKHLPAPKPGSERQNCSLQMSLCLYSVYTHINVSSINRIAHIVGFSWAQTGVITLTYMSFDGGRKPEYTEINPHEHREKNFTQNTPGMDRGLNLQPSCCEATVLTTELPYLILRLNWT